MTGDVVTVGQSQFFSATVADNEDPASSLSVEWTDSVDGVIYTGAQILLVWWSSTRRYRLETTICRWL